MQDPTNLIYNGDFSEGTTGWRGNNLSVTNGVATLTGNLYTSGAPYISVTSGNRYKLTFDLKVNTKCSSPFYMAFIPYDSSHAQISHISIGVYTTTYTTLASQLSAGDTTVSLTDGSNWHDAVSPYNYIGIFNNIAWGDKRATKLQKYSAISGNTLTLESAWTGSTYAAGTKVANTYDGTTYYYPVIISNANLPTEWTSYSATFTGGNNIRYSTQFILLTTLGYTHNYSIRNIRLENITTFQTCTGNGILTPEFSKNGNVKIYANESSRQIRYIKDYINGSDKNIYNHWVEIQALDEIGNNIAFNKTATYNNGTVITPNYATDGKTTTSSYISGSAPVIVDLGFATNISKIKVWHYWSDGRTYNDHTISVSVDGTNWDVIYKGTHAETSSGFEVDLSPNDATLHNSGIFDISNIIEN